MFYALWSLFEVCHKSIKWKRWWKSTPLPWVSIPVFKRIIKVSLISAMGKTIKPHKIMKQIEDFLLRRDKELCKINSSRSELNANANTRASNCAQLVHQPFKSVKTKQKTIQLSKWMFKWQRAKNGTYSSVHHRMHGVRKGKRVEYRAKVALAKKKESILQETLKMSKYLFTYFSGFLRSNKRFG